MKMTRLGNALLNRGAGGPRTIERLRERLAQINTRGLRDALDLGCGMGTVAAFLAETFGMSVCGADADPDQVELARRRHGGNERLRFEVEDASRLTFPAASFDLVVAEGVFHHIPNWEAAAREVARVLRPGGYLIWLDVAWPKLLQLMVRPLAGDAGLFAIGEIRDAFRDSGLEQRYHERLSRGPVHHHHLVLQKLPDGRSN